MIKIILILFLFLTSLAHADEPVTSTKFYPYAREQNEFEFELGGLQEGDNGSDMGGSGLYWLGLAYGRRLGKCLGFSEAACDQFLDLNLGFANNYQATDTMGLAGVRWQSTRSPFSPFVRLFGGIIDEHDEVRSGAVGTAGAGIGVIAKLHPRLDISLEMRAGEADRFWALELVAFSFRLDRVVTSTVEVTGKLIRSTVEAPKTFVDWFNDSGPKSESPATTGDSSEQKSK